MWYLYILRSDTKDKIYIGSTNDLERRLEQHNRGHTKSTKRFVPWSFVYVEKFLEKKDARDRERQLKNWKNRKRIESLIEKNPYCA